MPTHYIPQGTPGRRVALTLVISFSCLWAFRSFAQDPLGGLEGLYDKFEDAREDAPPAICLIDMTHPDTIRKALELKDGNGRLADMKRIKTRLEELAGVRCFVTHYLSVSSERIEKSSVKAIALNAADKEILKGEREKLFKLIRGLRVPIIGFCGGGQLLAEAYGGEISFMRDLRLGEVDPRPSYQPGKFKEWGFLPIRIVKPDPIFNGMQGKIVVREMHAWFISKLPSEFEILAESDECPAQLIRHKTKTVYGCQFHPERYDPAHEDGKAILVNFFKSAGLASGLGQAAD